MPTHKTILFAGGGSGGHIAPLVAVMQAVHASHPDVKLHYVGLPSDLDSSILRDTGVSFVRHSIQAGKLHRHLTVDHFRQFGRLLSGFSQASRLLKTIRPDAVLCKGSMVSVPIAFAAWRLGIPVYSHETDVVPGLANRIISRFASRIFTAFPIEAYKGLPAGKLVYTGQPIREAFRTTPSKRKKGLPTVTVIGGSQGAHRINVLIQAGWETLLKEVRLIHLSGERDIAWLNQCRLSLPEELAHNLELSAFDPKTPELFAASTVVVTRAGGTVAELAASGTAAILIPLSTAAQNHQNENAAYLSKTRAALVVDETTATSEELVAMILGLIGDEARLSELRTAIKALDRPSAAADMAKQVLAGVGKKRKIR